MKAVLLLAFVAALSESSPLPKHYHVEMCKQNPAIQRLREYIRIDTSQEKKLKSAVEFWKRQAQEAGLKFAVYRPAGKPICVLTWRGTNPTLPSIMLNSHMDVVGVEPETWMYPPFDAHIDGNGDIYGRGTQDTKDTGIQYLEAIRKLKEHGVTLRRTLHITLMPDEESGGFQGMVPFLDTDDFKALNVGFALDEGMTSDDDTLQAFYVDRRPWQMNITVHGLIGHGSSAPQSVVGDKFRSLIETISDYRSVQLQLKQYHPDLYNNVNINMVEGGYQANVIPSKMSLVVDVRLGPLADVNDMQDEVDLWKAVGGRGTTVTFLRQINESVPTPVDDSNPYWMAFLEATDEMNIPIKPDVCPATSDINYARFYGIPAIGFTPKSYTASRIHGANEYINCDTFLRGIDIYVAILKKIGNLK